MKVIDLFCGAGGFSEGFRQAGFEIVLGVDNWGVACRTFRENQKCEILCEDLKKVKGEGLPECDVLIGSPPCKEWSIGKQGKRTFDRSLIKAFQRVCKEIKPKYWIWECVAPTCEISTLYCTTLDAYDFGVPQKRVRAFHSNFPLPKGTEKGKTLNEVFGWDELKVLYNHRTLNRDAYSPIYASNRPARTAVTWPIRIYKEGVFTVEMMTKIQGFPEAYFFDGTEEEQYRQIGNAVPPPVARAIANNILAGGKQRKKGLWEVFT